MDSNHRYRMRNNPFWLPPFGPRNSPSATKNGSFVLGTDGSNPSPSSAESSANLTFGFPRQAPTAIAGASRNKVTSRIYGVGEWRQSARAKRANIGSNQTQPSRPGGMGDRTAVLDWRDRLRCSRRGGREIDMVVSGTERR